MKTLIDEVKSTFSDDQKIQAMFENCFSNTYETTIRPQDDGTTFVITGDIPAMWLRDSAAQVRPYLMLAENDTKMADLIEGVINKQFACIIHDSYANAFNEEANGKRYHDDKTEMTSLLWERKYEIDSLCYPIQLAYLFWKSTGRTTQFNQVFREAVTKIIETWEIEQNHGKNSNYQFERDNCPPQDTLSHDGKGAPVGFTGMTWSGFRPSDDACEYGYLIPSNMFAVVVLKQLAEIADEIIGDKELAKTVVDLANEIDQGIQKFGKVDHPMYGTIYAYETDGLGNYNLMDDANVPSLLALPYMGYCSIDDPIYQNTRKFILSEENPYYYHGKVAKGIGSPHTPKNYIWHIALAIQGMTASTSAEKEEILDLFKTTDANTNCMHEGFHVDDPGKFTRPWFSWANSMFSEFILSQCNRVVKGSPLAK
ncbi:metal-independent alpha-mannosidase [Virgibacillus necropolis]|uniref:Metal-independent alpha-mannosidase n=2 Tax=Virgibacillus necropolis TaxID=163877 RepID=A0A221MHZ3_9BACI|nr:glycoside hydrolase family 125 protein [Virgibacillus necropolis]ASN07283.1 metal-independent alpha-mannosidase [Virgibacillus necropolis]